TFSHADVMLAAHGHLIVSGYETQPDANGPHKVYDIDPATGATRAWAPAFTDPSGQPSVYALASDDQRLYVGGTFQSVDGQPTGGIAAVRWSDMGLEPIAFDAVQNVHALTASQGHLIAMGDAPGRTSPTIATLDAATGALGPNAPLPLPYPMSMYSFAGP